MEKMNRKTPIVVYIAAILLWLTFITSSLTAGLFARYVNISGNGDFASVAKFVFNVSDDTATHFIDLENIKKPGDKIEYRFKVTNSDSTGICEVAQRYTVDIQIDGNMPLVCTLQKNGEVATTGSSLSNVGEFPAGTEKTDIFILTVVWPNDMNDAMYANGAALGRIVLTIGSQQVD